MFLDMRPIYGDESLAKDLMKYVHDNITVGALKPLVDIAFHSKPIIGLLGKLRYGREGINIKLVSLLPIVQLVKVLAVKAKITATSTLDRIHLLVKRGVIDSKTGEELREAFQFLSILRLKHQLRQILANEKVDNNLKLGELTKFEETLLKASFRTLKNIAVELNMRY